MPERKVFVRVQAARHADGAARVGRLLFGALEELVELVGIGVAARGTALTVGKHLFAPVAGVIRLAVVKGIA